MKKALAEKIANDIAESIDCGEERKTLRSAIGFWANQTSIATEKLRNAEAKIELFVLAKNLMDATLKGESKKKDNPYVDLEKAESLIRRILIYSSHLNLCLCNSDEDPTCTCGYYELLREIEDL